MPFRGKKYLAFLYLNNEIFSPIRHMIRKLEVNFTNPPVRLRVALSLKGWAAHKKLVAQHTQAPQIHRFVVGLALNHLRGQVIQGPTQSLSSGVSNFKKIYVQIIT